MWCCCEMWPLLCLRGIVLLVLLILPLAFQWAAVEFFLHQDIQTEMELALLCKHTHIHPKENVVPQLLCCFPRVKPQMASNFPQ